MAKLYGLFVGVNEYQSDDLPNLNCAANDVERAFEIIFSTRKECDFRLLINCDATVENIKGFLGKVSREAESEDSLLIFLSGHGTTIQSEGQSHAVFLTKEYDPATFHEQVDVKQGVRIRSLRDWIRTGKRFKNLIILLDCCYSGLAITPGALSSMQNDQGDSKGDLVPKVHDAGAQAGQSDGLISTLHDSWPARGVVILSASDGLTPAYEFPSVGHGLFSCGVLEWWRKYYAAGKSENFGEDLSRHLELTLQEKTASFPEPRQQKIGKLLAQKVSFGTGTDWPNDGAEKWLRLGELHVPTSKMQVEGAMRENGSIIFENISMASDRGNCSNLVFSCAPLMGVRESVSDAIQRLGAEHEVVYLGANFFDIALPYLCALGNSPVDAGPMFELATEPPVIERTYSELIDFRVAQFSERRTVLIISYHSPHWGRRAREFLNKCINSESIVVCFLVHHDEGIPQLLMTTEHKRIELKPRMASIEGEEVSEAIGRLPERLQSSQLAAWLKFVGDPSLAAELAGWYEEQSNPVTVFGRLIDRVIEKVKDSPGGAATLQLLKALSLFNLPRTSELVKNVAGSLRAREKESSIAAEDQLKLLMDSRLIAAIDSPRSKRYSAGDIYLVHYFVIARVLDRMSIAELRDFHEDCARAYECVLGAASRDSSVSRWPIPILAHECVSHYIQSDSWPEVVSILERFGNDLSNAGYQERMLKWIRKGRSITLQGRLDALEIRLLLLEQGIQRHLQEVERVEDIHSLIARKLERLNRSPGAILSQQGKRLLLKSKENLATAQFIRRKYLDALINYTECAREARRLGFSELRRSCVCRVAHIYVQLGMIGEADQVVRKLEGELGSDAAQSWGRVHRHLLTVKVDRNRVLEDSEKLYSDALRAWELAMDPAWRPHQRDFFGLAIARIHMAWACLFRGEFVRALNHCLRARQFLMARGIAELYWVTEVERIIGLALVVGLSAKDTNYEDWYGRPLGQFVCIGNIYNISNKKQIENLKRLVDLCSDANPWRSLELRSALEQLTLASNGTRSLKGLKEVYDLALDCGHATLAGYVMEVIAKRSSKRKALLKRAVDLTDSAQLPGVFERRKRNLEHDRTASVDGVNRTVTLWYSLEQSIEYCGAETVLGKMVAFSKARLLRAYFRKDVSIRKGCSVSVMNRVYHIEEFEAIREQKANKRHSLAEKDPAVKLYEFKLDRPIEFPVVPAEL